MMDQVWLIVGATSSIARAFARLVSQEGASVILAGRDTMDLQRMAADCQARGAASAKVLAMDLRDRGTFTGIVETLQTSQGTINVAVFAGSMPEQSVVDGDASLIEGVIADSYSGPAELLHLIAPLIEERGGGTIVGVCSVAGDRGRIENYVYGSAKAGFATYLSGLRNRLTRAGGHVVTVKPGFVDTAMTFGLQGMFLVAPPEKVAQDILSAVRKKKNVIYTPFFWRYIMLIIRHIPEAIFKKLSI
jgi:short-subunit dehydrogenase